MHLPINKAVSVSDNEQLSGVQEAAVTQEETDAGVTAGGDRDYNTFENFFKKCLHS